MSIVCLNAYLPSIARSLPASIQALEDLRSAKAAGNAEAVADAETEQQRVLSRGISHTSAQAIALGYAAGVIALLLCLIPVKLLHNTYALRISVAGSGIWWLIGTLACVSLFTGGPKDAVVAPRGFWDGWKSVYQVLKAVTQLSQTFTFLAAWFLLSDVGSFFRTQIIELNQV